MSPHPPSPTVSAKTPTSSPDLQLPMNTPLCAGVRPHPVTGEGRGSCRGGAQPPSSPSPVPLPAGLVGLDLLGGHFRGDSSTTPPPHKCPLLHCPFLLCLTYCPLLALLPLPQPCHSWCPWWLWPPQGCFARAGRVGRRSSSLDHSLAPVLSLADLSFVHYMSTDGAPACARPSRWRTSKEQGRQSVQSHCI